MDAREVPVKPHIVVISGIVLILVTLLALTLLPDSRRTQRLSAQVRWTTHALDHYRIVVQVERLGRICAQELEVQGQQTRTLHDTCAAPWVSTLTVRQLFEFSSWMERGSDCYPSSSNCPCQRVRVGNVAYDPVFGYPKTIAWQRDVHPSPDHLDYWRKAWDQRALPECNATSRPFHVTVMSLTPLP